MLIGASGAFQKEFGNALLNAGDLLEKIYSRFIATDNILRTCGLLRQRGRELYLNMENFH